MTDLSEKLEGLGLSQYFESFVAEGFDTWEIVLDVTESDLNYLNVKLGHRRKLQRAIAESRGQPPDKALVADSRKGSVADRSDDSGAEPRDSSTRAGAGHGSSAPGSGTKRKYRRHPKADPNAPERPPSAYVIFSNQIREELRGQDLSFTEIAKVVGERWQILPADVREACEQQANTAKEKYYSELAEYKKTPEYAQYQEYLTEFKAKHGGTRAEGKRSKLESEYSTTSLPTTSHTEAVERMQGSRSAPLISGPALHSSGSSPPSTSGLASHSGFRRASASASPALYSDAINSPVKGDPYSPGSSSPSITLGYPPKDPPHHPRGRPPDSRREQQLPPLGAFHRHPGQGEGWPEAHGQQSYDHHSKRTSQASPPPLPTLTRQGSTLSSPGTPSNPVLPPAALLPLPELSKSGLTLPQPVPSGHPQRPQPVPLIRPSGPGSQGPTLPSIAAATHPDAQSWPALLRASEMAREADLGGRDRMPDRRRRPPE